MRRLLGIAFALIALGQCAQAQMWYPSGYGGYGMSRWGADPAAGYMAGLGAYARGQGVYALDKAKADAINVETMLKWNKALRARQIALHEERLKENAQRVAARDERVARESVDDGMALNRLLLDILDSDPGAVKSSRAGTPLSPAAIREIPFEWDSEAVTICVDQMTGRDSLPGQLMATKYAPDRKLVREAVETAIAEDMKREVSPASRDRVVEAVARFRAHFVENTSELESGYQEAIDYLTTLSSLTRLLNDTSMKTFLSQLENDKERTVGDLVSFMNAFNLRFGPAVSERQVAIYRRLAPALREVRDAALGSGTPRSTPDRTGLPLKAAAKEAFKKMNWGELEAHAHAHGQ